jgi:uncharacterized membrane protein YkgB
LVTLVGAVACIPGCDSVMFILLPGVFVAALAFPEGIHSSSGAGFLVLAGVSDILLFAFLVMFFWKLMQNRRQRQADKL